MADERRNVSEAQGWRREYAALQEAGSARCPDDEALAGLVTGDVAGEERTRLADHVVACRRCAESYRILRELDLAAARDRPRAAGRRIGWLLATAASVLLVSWLGAWIVGGRIDAPPDRRVVRSAAAGVAPAPESDAELAAAPPELAWTGLARGAGYRVRLFDATAEPLWESAELVASRVALPEEVRARLVPGASYFWVVEVDGAAAASSRLGPFWFHLRDAR